MKQGDYESAISSFQDAIIVAPDYFDGYWGMARCLDQLENWKESLKWYEKSLTYRPEW
jgi:tetratricopeptide (TPR) repeat protein